MVHSGSTSFAKDGQYEGVASVQLCTGPSTSRQAHRKGRCDLNGVFAFQDMRLNRVFCPGFNDATLTKLRLHLTGADPHGLNSGDTFRYVLMS